MLLLPAASQAAPKVTTAQFGMSVPASPRAARAAAGGRLVTPVLRAPRRFDLVGAEWRSGPGAVWLRGRRLAGRWSPWVRLEPSEEPSRSGARFATEPVWAGGDDLVQVRSSRPLGGLHLSFVDAHVPGAVAAAHKAQVTLPSGGQLPITPRAAWGASRCKPRRTAGYGRVDLAIVHHTESLNGYSRAESPSVVLGICLFHRNVNDWNDIGYDFLVDRFGQVFEGRAGGVDAPVIGAQAGGFNVFSTGVAAIGDFRFRRFSAAGMNSLAQLLAWKLSLDGVPAEGTVTVVSDGGVFTPFRKGTPVTLNRIAGHRDADSTVCPGNALYAQLPGLRTRVAQLEGPVSRLELTVPQPKLVYPQPLVFSGRLTPAPGLALPPGATVEIRDQLAKGGRVLATLPVAADGSFSGVLPLIHDDVVEAVFRGGGGLPPLVSSAWHVTVAPAIALRAGAASVPRGGTVTLSGTVTPPKSHLTIDEEELRGSHYRLVRTLKLRAQSGAFSVVVGLARSGSFRFSAHTPGSHTADPGASAPVAVQVAG
ncbi:MAG TPA: N-acetylmuramoyl-L-alanine amidase [Thermoleophilaceae bacterium]